MSWSWPWFVRFTGSDLSLPFSTFKAHVSWSSSVLVDNSGLWKLQSSGRLGWNVAVVVDLSDSLEVSDNLDVGGLLWFVPGFVLGDALRSVAKLLGDVFKIYVIMIISKLRFSFSIFLTCGMWGSLYFNNPFIIVTPAVWTPWHSTAFWLNKSIIWRLGHACFLTNFVSWRLHTVYC